MYTTVSHHVFVLAFTALINHITISSSDVNIHPLYQRLRRQSSCSQLEFKCANGDCIPSYSVCDGTRECADGSDETREACTAVRIRCPAMAFECAYGACIDRELRCDGKSDCVDNSDEVCPQSGPSKDCPDGKFQCSNGECIDQYSVCDGSRDCTDQSDETKNLCKDLVCPTSSFQCDYGACIENVLRCDKKNDCHDGSDEAKCPVPGVNIIPSGPVREGEGCRLPQHPKNGLYISSQCVAGDARTACRNIPGTPVPDKWLLEYRCNANFDISSQDSNEYSVCSENEWKNPLDCIRLCPPLEDISMDIVCEYNNREVPCTKRMKPNTTAVANCKQHYREIYPREYSNLVCQENGQWSYRLFYCSPDCGVSTGVEILTPLILNGSPTRQGEFPWLASLYMRSDRDEWEQKCGGTLVTPHIVLTAAHCLVSENTGLIEPQNIKVGLGKYYRDYYKRENYSVIADVKEVVVPRFYSGRPSFFALDIGLIDLKTSVQVTAYIMPACVHWQTTIRIRPGTTGHVAGWGKTGNGTSSEVVMTTNLTYIDNNECIRKVRQVYQKLVTHDKFCAGASSSGGQVAQGDSGGGMTVVEKGQHFVFGVVSTKIVEETAISLFTDLSNTEHHSWLEEHKTRLTRLHNQT
uniref:Peptidase S1 domain-containing protein n=1 Tax=Graphocephala atropunctata TaxID=36148 RepID=A0A1B6KNQ0_9HEMI